MAAYEAVQARIAKLEKQAEALREKEKGKAVTLIRKLIAEFDIQQNELFSNVKQATAKASVGRPAGVTPAVKKTRAIRKKQVRPPKYLDPATGKTWNGHGKPPAWLGGLSNRDKFLIAPLAVEQSADSVKAAEELKPTKAKRGGRRKLNAAAKPAKTAKAPKAVKTVEAESKPKKTRAKRGSKTKNAAPSPSASNGQPAA
jgi:DNA-binding protein H-NS